MIWSLVEKVGGEGVVGGIVGFRKELSFIRRRLEGGGCASSRVGSRGR